MKTDFQRSRGLPPEAQVIADHASAQVREAWAAANGGTPPPPAPIDNVAQRELASQALAAWTSGQASAPPPVVNPGQRELAEQALATMAPPPPRSMSPEAQAIADNASAQVREAWAAGPGSPVGASTAPEVAQKPALAAEPAAAIEQPQQPPIMGRPPRGRRPSLLNEQGLMAAMSRDELAEAQGKLDENVESQAQLTEKAGSEKAAMLAREAELLREKQEALEEAGFRAQAEREAARQAADEVSQQYRILSDQVANTEIADRRTTGQRVMGAIAIALGGMGSYVSGDGGKSLQSVVGIVNDAVDRDLAIQRANLDNKRNAVQAKFSELGAARAAIKDVEAQEAAARAMLLEKYAVGLEGISKQGLGEQASTLGMLSAEQIRGQGAELLLRSKDQTATKEGDRLFQLRVQEEQERKAAARAAAMAKNRKQPQTVAELEAKEKAGTLTDDEKLRLTEIRTKEVDLQKKVQDLKGKPGDGLVAPKGRTIADPVTAAQATKEQRSKFAEEQNVTDELEGKIDRLLKLRSDKGFRVGMPGTDAYKEANTLGREIMLQLKKKQQLGTLDNQSERFLNEMSGDPSAWFFNTPDVPLSVIKENARADIEARARSLGYSSAGDNVAEYWEKYGFKAE